MIEALLRDGSVWLAHYDAPPTSALAQFDLQAKPGSGSRALRIYVAQGKKLELPSRPLTGLEAVYFCQGYPEEKEVIAFLEQAPDLKVVIHRTVNPAGPALIGYLSSRGMPTVVLGSLSQDPDEACRVLGQSKGLEIAALQGPLVTDAGLAALAKAPRLRGVLAGAPVGNDRHDPYPARQRYAITDKGLAAVAERDLELLSIRSGTLSKTALEPLASRTGLKFLELGSWLTLTGPELQPLAGLTGLEELRLPAAPGLVDLSALEQLRGLLALDLSCAPTLTDTALAPLWGMEQMHWLSLAGCAKLTDKGLAVLEKMHALRYLNLGSAGVWEPGRSGKATQLGAPKVKGPGLQHLGATLTRLRLEGARSLTDTSALARLSGLKEINLMDAIKVPATAGKHLLAIAALQSAVVWKTGISKADAGKLEKKGVRIAGP